jgi:outer membrane lipoprotein LolB
VKQRHTWGHFTALLSAVSTTLFTIILVAGCAIPAGGEGLKSLKKSEPESYAGRISLVVEPDANATPAQPQAFSGSFELRGTAQAGELDLLTPLGQIAAQLRWQSGQALLIRGNERQIFSSAQTLLQQATGASISLEQLFGWLRNDTLSDNLSTRQTGDWQVDVSARANGRITVRRSQPTPAVLRIILEQP